MTDREFEALAVRVAIGAASEEEQAQVAAAIAVDPNRKSILDELKLARGVFKELASMADAMSAPPVEPPPKRLQQLRRSVRAHWNKPDAAPESADEISWLIFFKQPRIWAGALALALVLALLTSILMRQQSGGESHIVAYVLTPDGVIDLDRRPPSELRFPAPVRSESTIRIGKAGSAFLSATGVVHMVGPGTVRGKDFLPNPAVAQTQLAKCLFTPAANLSTANVVRVMRSSVAFPIYSPSDCTHSLSPAIIWRAAEGRTYDIVVRDEIDPAQQPWVIRGASSPVTFSAFQNKSPLRPDSLYRIRISPSGTPGVFETAEQTFTTEKDSAPNPYGQTSSQKILNASRWISNGTGCYGDVLAELSSLPPEMKDNPMVLRLKLFSYGMLGLQREFEMTLQELPKSAE